MNQELEAARNEVTRIRRFAKSTADFWMLQTAIARVRELEAAERMVAA